MTTTIAPQQTAFSFNTTCTLEAFSNPLIAMTLNVMAPRWFDGTSIPPERIERKNWEEAMTFLAMHHFGALRPESHIMAVAAGHELNVYAMTNHVRRVYATDIYGDGDFAGIEAQGSMLRDPAAFAPAGLARWRPGRLVVEHMNALALRADDDDFDGAFSQSSIEHMGGLDGAIQAIREMARIVRPGGVVAVATECCVNGAPAYETPGFSIFTPQQFEQLASCSPKLEPVGPFMLPENPYEPSLVLELSDQVRKVYSGIGIDRPHIYLHEQGRIFTSGLLVWRRVG